MFEIGEALQDMLTTPTTPRRTKLLDHSVEQPQAFQATSTAHSAPAAPIPGESLTRHGSLRHARLVGSLVMEVRRYEDLRRAHGRLTRQVKGMCRYACDGDTKAGQALCAEALGEPKSELAINVLGMMLPYLEAMKPLEAALTITEKTIISLTKQLPIWKAWGANIKGLSARFLGLIIGEAHYPPGEFKSPAALWKRMGLAVIDGGRQTMAAGERGVMMGYCPRRRCLMWNVGNSLLKGGIAHGVARSIYGQLYMDRKAYELTRTDINLCAHNRAKRYVEKRLLRDLWRAWRAASGILTEGGDVKQAPGESLSSPVAKPDARDPS
jgi:hypothetical protein